MQEERRENSFTAKDRKVLYDVSDKVDEINGTVKRHDEEIFGNSAKSTKGLIKAIAELHDFRVSVQTAIRVIVVLLGLIGVTNLVILFRGG